MRVIAGEFRSRRLKSIPGMATRPTPDRLRETLFNILAPRIEGAVFLDAYAGTGAVGIEALSRGARHAWFLERSRPAIEVLRENLASLELGGRATVVPGPVLLTIARCAADIVFLDPPYEAEREYRSILDWLGEHSESLVPCPASDLTTAPSRSRLGIDLSEARDTTLVVVQHSTHFTPAQEYGRLRRLRMAKHGDNVLSFYAGT